MSGRRAPCTFRRSDITRALKAARAAGFVHVRVEIDNGKIAIVATDNPEVGNVGTPLNEWDTVK